MIPKYTLHVPGDPEKVLLFDSASKKCHFVLLLFEILSNSEYLFIDLAFDTTEIQ